MLQWIWTNSTSVLSTISKAECSYTFNLETWSLSQHFDLWVLSLELCFRKSPDTEALWCWSVYHYLLWYTHTLSLLFPLIFSFSEMYPVDNHSLVFSPFLRNFMGSVQIFFSQLVFYILYTCSVILRKPPRVQKGFWLHRRERLENGRWKQCHHFQRWCKGCAHVGTSHSSFDPEAPAYYYHLELNSRPCYSVEESDHFPIGQLSGGHDSVPDSVSRHRGQLKG
jgi:hypothetical protein